MLAWDSSPSAAQEWGGHQAAARHRHGTELVAAGVRRLGGPSAQARAPAGPASPVVGRSGFCRRHVRLLRGAQFSKRVASYSFLSSSPSPAQRWEGRLGGRRRQGGRAAAPAARCWAGAAGRRLLPPGGFVPSLHMTAGALCLRGNGVPGGQDMHRLWPGLQPMG